jgi:hypothetical protein
MARRKKRSKRPPKGTQEADYKVIGPLFLIQHIAEQINGGTPYFRALDHARDSAIHWLIMAMRRCGFCGEYFVAGRSKFCCAACRNAQQARTPRGRDRAVSLLRRRKEQRDLKRYEEQKVLDNFYARKANQATITALNSQLQLAKAGERRLFV